MTTAAVLFAAASAGSLLVAVTAFWRPLATTFSQPQQQGGNPFLVLGVWGGVLPAFALQLMLSLPIGGRHYLQSLLCAVSFGGAIGIAWVFSQAELQPLSARQRWGLRGATGLGLILLFWLLAALRHTY